MELSGNHLDHTVACFDPECVDEAGAASRAEPEQDATHTCYVCPRCGGEFGHRRLDTAAPEQAQPEGTCAVGIPAAVRRAASAPMQHTLAGERRLPLLRIGRRPDAPTS